MKDLNGKNKGLPTILIIFSGFMFAGFCLTFLLPETKGKTLEQLNGENGEEQTEDESIKNQLKSFFKKFRKNSNKTNSF